MSRGNWKGCPSCGAWGKTWWDRCLTCGRLYPEKNAAPDLGQAPQTTPMHPRFFARLNRSCEQKPGRAGEGTP